MTNSADILLSKIDPNNLPAIPRVLLDLMNAVQSPDVGMSELANIIGQDAGLSAKVLAAANSPFYRQWGEITDLNRVVVVLGLTTVKTIAITRAVQQFFNQLPQSQQNLLELIWYRSLSCAHLARSLAVLTAYDFPDEAYLAGLLHRLGQLILLTGFPKEYPEFLINHFDDQHPQEELQFGVYHNEVGAHLISSWKLQSFLSDAVLYQYHPLDALADTSRLVKIVRLASELSRINHQNKDLTLVQAGELFGLHQGLLEDMLTGIKPMIERSAGSLGISIAQPEDGSIKNLTTPVQRQAVNKLLGDNIRNFALSAAVHKQLEHSEEVGGIVGIIQRDIQLLFGFQSAALFKYNATNESLEGLSATEQQQDALWPTLSITLKPALSLLAQALLEKQVKNSFVVADDVLALSDHQIRRLLASDGIMVIPLFTQYHSIGVIIVGLDKAAFELLKPNTDFITLFANEAASALQITQTSPSYTNNDMLAKHELHTRKLVHEISNPLSIINNYLYLLGQRLDENQTDEITIIQEEIERVGQILVRLSDSPESVSTEDFSYFDVNCLIVDLVKLFQVGLFKSHNINVSLQLDYTLPKLFSSRNKLKQILINLIKNAAEAMPAGGNILVCSLDRVYLSKNCYAEIQIQDNGPGIPKDIIDQLFTPHRSMANNHEGLGLTIAKQLTEEIKGILSCNSKGDRGTIFQIFLPRKIE